MTFLEATAALNLAPADDQLSAVEPNMKRRDVVLLTKAHLRTAPVTAIELMPAFARKVAAVVQDCPDPVELHFLYDRNGKLTVGWNREEVEIRKGLRPRYNPAQDVMAAINSHREQSLRNAYVGALTAAMQQQALSSAQTHPNGFGSTEGLARVMRERALKERSSLTHQPTPPKPEPKPDPTSPTFVLKRPKLV